MVYLEAESLAQCVSRRKTGCPRGPQASGDQGQLATSDCTTTTPAGALAGRLGQVHAPGAPPCPLNDTMEVEPIINAVPFAPVVLEPTESVDRPSGLASE